MAMDPTYRRLAGSGCVKKNQKLFGSGYTVKDQKTSASGHSAQDPKISGSDTKDQKIFSNGAKDKKVSGSGRKAKHKKSVGNGHSDERDTAVSSKSVRNPTFSGPDKSPKIQKLPGLGYLSKVGKERKLSDSGILTKDKDVSGQGSGIKERKLSVPGLTAKERKLSVAGVVNKERKLSGSSSTAKDHSDHDPGRLTKLTGSGHHNKPQEISGSGSIVIRPRLELACLESGGLESIPEFGVMDMSWSPCPSPRRPGSPGLAARSHSLPGPAGDMDLPLSHGTSPSLALPLRTLPPSGSPKQTTTDRVMKILVVGYTGVGKSALIVRYLTRRFIGDYAPYETMCSADTTVDCKRVKLCILDMSWQADRLEDIDRYLSWCDGTLLVFSLVDHASLMELITLCKTIESRLRTLPCVLVATKADLTYAHEVSHEQIQCISTEFSCPIVETSARESHASAAQAFVMLIQEIKANAKKPKSRKNGYSSKLQNIRERLRSLAGEFRQRTNTF